ncbi:hypothetical protein NDU88_008177 [Pleurodeles waltl]|uniref:Uncharacterized protein n=1 Tax=Pleurodeles waltl TaxID=8319 RepID=A0AAV7N5L7_PLEWA|nr:hypothetical protein NDU88_008177 [Pleurodeles waltl]
MRLTPGAQGYCMEAQARANTPWGSPQNMKWILQHKTIQMWKSDFTLLREMISRFGETQSVVLSAFIKLYIGLAQPTYPSTRACLSRLGSKTSTIAPITHMAAPAGGRLDHPSRGQGGATALEAETPQ